MFVRLNALISRSYFWKMDSASYDLGSLCSSPLLYPEGEDFLGQPVNVFYEEDISFDFIDTFGAGLSIAEKNTNEVSTTSRGEQDQILTSKSPTLGPNDGTEKVNINDEKTFNSESSRHKQAIESNNESGGSAHLHDHTSASECIESFTNEVTTNINSENQDSSEVCKNAEEDRVSQSDTRQDAMDYVLSRTDRDINRIKNSDRVDNSSSDSSHDIHNQFSENTYSTDINFNEKAIFNNLNLSPHGAHKISNRGTESGDLGKGSKASTLKKIDDSSFSVKNSAFKRCVVPKTFYSPFWTLAKSTAKQEKSLEDGLITAQRNVDILYCCNCTCRSHKRDVKNARFTVKQGLKDGNKYTDFLKRNSPLTQQGNSRRPHNKAINEELSSLHEEDGENKDKCISLPAIYTSSKPKTAQHNKPIGEPLSSRLSLTSIEGLIKKYKGHRFDLVEQQKRYRLKPFK